MPSKVVFSDCRLHTALLAFVACVLWLEFSLIYTIALDTFTHVSWEETFKRANLSFLMHCSVFVFHASGNQSIPCTAFYVSGKKLHWTCLRYPDFFVRFSMLGRPFLFCTRPLIYDIMLSIFSSLVCLYIGISDLSSDLSS